MAGLNFSYGGILGGALGSIGGPLGMLAGSIAGQKAGAAGAKALGIKGDPSYIPLGNIQSKPSSKNSGGVNRTPTRTDFPAGTVYDGGYGGGGSGGGGSYQDQQAAQIKQQQQSLLDQLGARLGSIYGSSTDAARNAGLNFDTTIKQFGLQTRQAQDAINQKGIQNEASKRAGTQDILGMVGRGLRSGGVMLANKNASNSSAAEALGRAYGDIGQREQSKVNNQYALANEDINSQQKALVDQQNLYRNATYANSKEQVIGGIVSSAQGQLAELDNALRGASLPDRIAIEGEKNKVRDIARNELAKYDQLLADEIASAHANSADENRSKATQLAQMGQALPGQFNYNTEAPANWQGGAPAGGNLPLYSVKRNQDDQNNLLAPQVA